MKEGFELFSCRIHENQRIRSQFFAGNLFNLIREIADGFGTAVQLCSDTVTAGHQRDLLSWLNFKSGLCYRGAVLGIESSGLLIGNIGFKTHR